MTRHGITTAAMRRVLADRNARASNSIGSHIPSFGRKCWTPKLPARLDRSAERSGLGFEARRKAVTAFLDSGNWRLVAEIVESGP